MANKQKLQQLLARLGELEDSLPGGEVKSAFERILNEKYSDVISKVKEDSSVKYLGEINTKLTKFKKDFNLKPILKQLDDFQALFDQLHESVVSQFEDVSNSSESTKKQLTDLIENTKGELSNMTTGEIKKIVQKISLLEDQLSFQDDTSKNQGQTLKEVISDFDTRITDLLNQFKKSSSTTLQDKTSMDSKMGEHEKTHSTLKEDIEKLRRDLMSKIANASHGGQANRQINVNSSLMSTKYTDINFQQSGNIGWSVTDDDVRKRVNIRASILVGGGGAGNPGGNTTEIQFNDGGSFGGASVLTWNKSTSTVSLEGNLGIGVTTTLVPLHVTGKSAFGDSVSSVRLSSGNGPRALNIIDTNGLARIWRFAASDPGIELISGTNDDATNSANKWWDIFINNASESLNFRRRTGGVNLTRLTIQPSIITSAVPFAISGTTSGTVTIQTASVAGSYIFTLPPNDGNTGQYLLTDGNGITQWASVAGGSGITRSVSVISVSSTFAAAASTDYVAFANVGITLTLPTAISNSNLYTVKNTSASSVLVLAPAGQDIDGSASALMPSTNESLTFVSNSSIWGVI